MIRVIKSQLTILTFKAMTTKEIKPTPPLEMGKTTCQWTN